MFNVINFTLVLGVCIVHVVIFIKKHFKTMDRISFCELLNIFNFENVGKKAMYTFSSLIKKNINYKKKKNITGSVLKKCQSDVFGFLIIHVFGSNLKKLTNILLF